MSNPNSRDITVDGMSFRVEVGERELAHGLTNKTVVLPPALRSPHPGRDERVARGACSRSCPIWSAASLSYGPLRGEVITHDFGRLPFDRKGELGAAKAKRS